MVFYLFEDDSQLNFKNLDAISSLSNLAKKYDLTLSETGTQAFGSEQGVSYKLVAENNTLDLFVDNKYIATKKNLDSINPIVERKKNLTQYEVGLVGKLLEDFNDVEKLGEFLFDSTESLYFPK